MIRRCALRTCSGCTEAILACPEASLPRLSSVLEHPQDGRVEHGSRRAGVQACRGERETELRAKRAEDVEAADVGLFIWKRPARPRGPHQTPRGSGVAGSGASVSVYRFAVPAFYKNNNNIINKYYIIN